MESLIECKNLYSWWWDSHVSPTNSKWLQENLTDMDTKVQAMIKLIEEDADSFAKRAEMYYKKRPELLKLVEHFYRAYRALAERYDHLTGELRQAHCNISETFPNQIHFQLKDDDHHPPFDTVPHTPEKIPSLLEKGHNSSPSFAEFEKITVDKEETEETYGYKTRKSLYQEGEFQDLKELSDENGNLKAMNCLDCKNAVNGDCEIRDLKIALSEMKAEKESLYLQYQICVKKLSIMEVELMNQSEKESVRLHEQTVQAQLEVQTMKQAFELDKEASMVIQKEYMEVLNDLKNTISQFHSEMEGSNNEVKELQYKNQFLYGANSALYAEKSALLAQIQTITENTQRVLNKNAVLENSLSGARIELECLQEKSKSLEEIFHLIKNEKFVLLAQKGTLVVQLANVEGRSEYLEKRLSWFEKKYADLMKEKEKLQSRVEELTISFNSEKHERINYETRFVTMESYINRQEEESSRKKMEAEILRDESERLRYGLYNVFKAISPGSYSEFEDQFENEQILVHEIIRNIDQFQQSAAMDKDEAELLKVENLILLTLTHQIQIESLEIKSKKELIEQEFNFTTEKVLKLSEIKRIQRKEIEELIEMNANLISELCKLHEVCEEHKNKQENLRLDLKHKHNEFKLCESETTRFYLDLEISSIHGVLYENIVHDLTEVCKSFQNQEFSTTMEIQELKEKNNMMDNEIEELKAELSDYEHIIASIGVDFTSLEHNTLLHLNIEVFDSSETKCAEAILDNGISFQDKPLKDPFFMPIGFQDLQKLQSRIQTLEKALVQEIKKLVMNQTPRLNGRTETDLDENEIHEILTFDPKEKLRIDLNNNIKLKNVTIPIKDVQLDHISDSLSYKWLKKVTIPIERADDKMLELWEAAEEDNVLKQCTPRVRRKPSFSARKRHLLSDPFESTIFEVETDIQEVNNKKIHERISYNTRKLTSLQLIIESLNKKLESKKKSYKKKSKDNELEMAEQQLKEVQESVFKIKEFNGQLITDLEDDSRYSECQETASLRRKSVLVKARKGSETIRKVQIEVQKLESMLSKLEIGMKSKGRSRFSKNNRTNIVLRDVIYNGKNSGNKKKDRLCGCFRPTTYCDSRKL